MPENNGNASTGPEHFKKAQTLLERVREHGYGDSEYTADLLAAAQVHATLALAAATAMIGVGEMPVSDSDTWMDVAHKVPGTSS